MTDGTDHGIGEAVAARIERRWATLSIVIVGVLVGMAAFIGIHQATMPQGHVETADPRRCICPANSSKAISAARSSPTAR